MQVNTQNIKRLSLFTPFMDEELDPANNYVEYIETSSNTLNVVHNKCVTSVHADSAKNSPKYNIKKSLNNHHFGVKANFRDMDTRAKYASKKMTDAHILYLRNLKEEINSDSYEELELENDEYILNLDVYPYLTGKLSFIVSFGLSNNFDVYQEYKFECYQDALNRFNHFKKLNFSPLRQNN